jgi:AbrB family looped-hinge helix DNA binding protein
MRTASSRVNDKNQIALPREVREALGVKTGDEVLFIFHDGEMHLRLRPASFAQVLRGLHKNVWADTDDVEQWLMNERRWWHERRKGDTLPPHVP